jgi:hypothetical protein
MQQLSHQTLNSASSLSTFATFVIFPDFIGLALLLLKARNGRAGVLRLMPAFVQRASQHKFSGRKRLAFSRSFAAVEGEQNGQAALFAANAEIPSHVGLGPSRYVQRISLPS